MVVHGFRRARALGLKPFASVFDHKALDFMERTGCPRYKIASFEILDLPLIEACARTGKPLIISTGMATDEEIRDAVHTAKSAGCVDLTLLHCVSAYPAPASSAGLLEMEVMARRYNCQVGLSDHTLGLGVPIAAAVLGAAMIEKHVTLDRNDGGPDATFSIEPNELLQLSTEINRAKQASSYQPYPRGTDPTEQPQRLLRRTLYWAKDIKAGETITPEHLKTMRPALGANPGAIGLFKGYAATQDHKAGDPVKTR
jgi:N-acetylneuraminate synthase